MVAAERGLDRAPSRFGWLVLGLLTTSVAATFGGILAGIQFTEPESCVLLTFGGTSSALLAMCLLLFARVPASAKAGAIATALLLLMAAPRLNGMMMNKSFDRLWARDGDRYEAFARYVLNQPPTLGKEDPWVRTTIDGRALNALRRDDQVLWIPVSGMLDSQLGLYYVPSGPVPDHYHALSGRWYWGSHGS
jgi:hypothetical protein